MTSSPSASKKALAVRTVSRLRILQIRKSQPAPGSTPKSAARSPERICSRRFPVRAGRHGAEGPGSGIPLALHPAARGPRRSGLHPQDLAVHVLEHSQEQRAVGTVHTVERAIGGGRVDQGSLQLGLSAAIGLEAAAASKEPLGQVCPFLPPVQAARSRNSTKSRKPTRRRHRPVCRSFVHLGRQPAYRPLPRSHRTRSLRWITSIRSPALIPNIAVCVDRDVARLAFEQRMRLGQRLAALPLFGDARIARARERAGTEVGARCTACLRPSRRCSCDLASGRK